MLPYRDSRIAKIALTVFFILLIAYGFYEASAVLYGPRIIIPSEIIVVHEAFTNILGKAQNIAELRMNGASVSVTEDGNFSEPYLASPGENRVTLEAKDRYGRTSRRVVEIMYIQQEKTSLGSTTIKEYSTTTNAIPPVE